MDVGADAGLSVAVNIIVYVVDINPCNNKSSPGLPGYCSRASRPQHHATQTFPGNYPHAHRRKGGMTPPATSGGHMRCHRHQTPPARPDCTACRSPGCIRPRLFPACSGCVCGWRVVGARCQGPSSRWRRSWRRTAWGCAGSRRWLPPLWIRPRLRPRGGLRWPDVWRAGSLRSRHPR